MNMRVLMFTAGLVILVAALGPFLNLYLGGYVEGDVALGDVVYLLGRHVACSHNAYVFAGFLAVVGFFGAGQVSNGKRIDISTTRSDSCLSPVNTNGSLMSNGGTDGTGHTIGSQRI